MRRAERKELDIPGAKIINKDIAIRVDNGDVAAAFQHVPSFGFFVPMQFPHHAGIQPHIHACQIFGGRQFARRGLASPASFFQPVMGHAKRKFEIWNGAAIGFRRRQSVRVLPVQLHIGGPGSVAPLSLRMDCRMEACVMGKDSIWPSESCEVMHVICQILWILQKVNYNIMYSVCDSS